MKRRIHDQIPFRPNNPEALQRLIDFASAWNDAVDWRRVILPDARSLGRDLMDFAAWGETPHGSAFWNTAHRNPLGTVDSVNLWTAAILEYSMPEKPENPKLNLALGDCEDDE